MKEREWYLCVFKLLLFFFSKEELVISNIDGIYEKYCFDSNKLNLFKVLVFSKFFVNIVEEKDRVWRCIKGKINLKCCVICKYLGKEVIFVCLL